MITFKSIGRMGRFANSLFEIAGTIGVATRSGQQYSFPKFISYDQHNFNPSDEIEVYKHFVNQLPELPENLQFNEVPYRWEYEDLYLPNGNWNLNSHFQSFKYFEHCRETILHYFRMKDEPEQNDYTMIHARYGDYTEGIEGYHPRMSKDYYQQAILQFPKGTKFVVFSDDIKSFIQDVVFKLPANMMVDYKLTYSEGKTYFEDFKLMKRCKSFIIANSSFSAMAAWLGEHPEKKVISPSWDNWFGKASNINAKDLIHKDWIQIKTW